MARNKIIRTPSEFATAQLAWREATTDQQVEDLYNRAVDIINAGENDKLCLTTKEMAYVPAVNRLLEKSGFTMRRFLSTMYYITVV